ncbi:MAG: hypothetical protein AB7J28_15430 [Hyphomonadaceae bacterium]
MADRSPAFNPPMNSLPSEKDPMIVKVPMEKMDWAARRSQQENIKAGDMGITHVPNGR